MHRTMRAALMAALLAGVAQPAAAQRPWETPWADRVFGGINFGFDGGSPEIAHTEPITIYGETGDLSSRTSFDSDSIFDLTVGARVWGNVGVALGYTSKSSSAPSQLEGNVPHPGFFDRSRYFAQAIDGIDRDERAVHLQFGYMLPVNDKLDVFVSVGPSFYRLTQEVVNDIAVAEVGPPYVDILVQPTIAERKESATGYNVGVDASYILYTRDRLRVGLGAFLRFTGATADLQIGNSRVETDLGGTQFGIGARFRF